MATAAPGYWMNETSGVLKPAVEAYLSGDPLDQAQIAALRAYMRQWIMAPVWRGKEVVDLRRRVDGLSSRQTIERWLDDALELDIDPL